MFDFVLNIPIYTQVTANEDGYFLLPGHRETLKDSAIGYFKERPDCEFLLSEPFLPVFGIRHNGKAHLYVVTSNEENANILVKVKDNIYSFFFCFTSDETPEIKEFILTGDEASYNGMARAYRNYLLENGFVSIKDRLCPKLSYSAESIYVRIRHGWKPVPCKIHEQTLENEPPMHVACTFSDVENLMHEYKEAGIEKAEFCLVGWNISGHDGRWPEAFPPEPKLGGIEGLKKLIATAKKLGYSITCHTNSTDGYTIAENFEPSLDGAVKKDGEYSIEAVRWSGGRTYNICPKRGYEYAMETLPKIAELGFHGIHYIDVITCTPPRECFNKNHPVSKKEAIQYYDKLFAMTRKLFGGAASESGFIHNLKNIDFALYASFLTPSTPKPDIIDEYIPFWQLVFHGIILSNPYAVTVNAALSGNPDLMLKLIEYGGKPVIYYYSQFVDNGTDWIGDKDFTFENKNSTAAAVKSYEVFKELSYLQYEFMEKHEKIAENIYKVTYSDGSTITVDYNQKNYTLKKGM